ncbi:MAG: DNA-directed RNA polymerase subunit H [Nanobdellota archaeon]
MVENKLKHVLIPEHKKLSKTETKELFEEYKITVQELPKIPKSDPAIAELNAIEGEVIKITRSSPTAGTTIFYRGVSSE